MIKLSNKIISSIVGIVIAGGAVTVGATTINSRNTASSVPPVSSKVVSSAALVSSVATVSSKEAVSNVTDGIKQIQKATDDGVSAINKAAANAVSEVNSAKSGSKKAPNIRYPVIDIENGCRPVDPDASDYQKCKDALSAYGNDAGTCNPDNSKACQAALAALKAKQSAAAQAPAK